MYLLKQNQVSQNTNFEMSAKPWKERAKFKGILKNNNAIETKYT